MSKCLYVASGVLVALSLLLRYCSSKQNSTMILGGILTSPQKEKPGKQAVTAVGIAVALALLVMWVRAGEAVSLQSVSVAIVCSGVIVPILINTNPKRNKGSLDL